MEREEEKNGSRCQAKRDDGRYTLLVVLISPCLVYAFLEVTGGHLKGQ